MRLLFISRTGKVKVVEGPTAHSNRKWQLPTQELRTFYVLRTNIAVTIYHEKLPQVLAHQLISNRILDNLPYQEDGESHRFATIVTIVCTAPSKRDGSVVGKQNLESLVHLA
ncbi:hypothetical protein AVEN_99970-1 [Araneus ventricosus]|uniref:Uncharacterized protein n=1 Tax=Araneus ventricosus TaxID=182803 RepID=A0A4Y2QHC1_ARAVE|nr:hypothetical protein AVEN_99970-1 [Araneus ventricosus]